MISFATTISTKAVENGHPISVDLELRMNMLRDVPLSENLGEGYHRGTALTVSRLFTSVVLVLVALSAVMSLSRAK